MILLFTAIILQCSLVESMRPKYSFRCQENGAIELFGVASGSKLLNMTGNTCGVGDVNATTPGMFIIPKRCADLTTGNQTVTIVVYDPKIDGVTPSTTTIMSVDGGHGTHQFQIICNSIPSDGVNKTVVHVFRGNYYNVLPENHMEVDDVEMRFKAVNNTNAPDINTIYVGEKFFMFLEYKGEQPYSLVPKKCSAYLGTLLGSNVVKLWSWDGKPHCAPQKELLENFESPKNNLVVATMYGFRFSNSDFITMQCEVGIFVQKVPNLCKGALRRRRGIESVEVKTKFTVSKLRVFDNKKAYRLENNCPQISVDIFAWIVSLVGTLIYHW